MSQMVLLWSTSIAMYALHGPESDRLSQRSRCNFDCTYLEIWKSPIPWQTHPALRLRIKTEYSQTSQTQVRLSNKPVVGVGSNVE